MTEENSGIKVGEEGKTVFVRIDGRGTHLNSHLLKEYLLGCLGDNNRVFQIDLANCNYMDSTFLGMLAGLGIKVRDRGLSQIQLVNVNERVHGMLQNLGIDHLFQMADKKNAEADLTELSGEEISKDAKSREMLEAHEKLIAVSPANEAKFRDVIALLREKVKGTDSK
jgi:anti-sigma B factor antagonist